MADSEQVFTCTYCDEVTPVVIQCAICPDFDLCRECFESGAEIGPHKKTHDFRIMAATFQGSIFPGLNNWEAQEEIKLIDKVLRYGCGEWDKIAESFPPKTPEEIRDHFCQLFVEGNIGKVTFGKFPPFDMADTSKGTSDDTILSDTETPNDKVDAEKEICKTLQYNPIRDDYFQEYDDDAEDDLLVCLSDRDLTDDEELNIPLKKACVDIYVSRVKTRHRRHAFVREYDLIKEFEDEESSSQTSQTEKDNISKDESSLRSQMRIFNRLMPVSEMESFIKTMTKEKNLKSRIKELKAKLPKPVKRSISPNGKIDPTKLKQYKTLKENSHKKVVGDVSSPVSLGSPQREMKNPTPDIPCLKKKSEKHKDKTDSFELLTKAERRLCSDLDLEPTCYMALKLVLLKERNHNTETCKYVPPTGVSKSGLQKVNSYLYTSGWIPNS